MIQTEGSEEGSASRVYRHVEPVIRELVDLFSSRSIVEEEDASIQGWIDPIIHVEWMIRWKKRTSQTEEVNSVRDVVWKTPKVVRRVDLEANGRE